MSGLVTALIVTAAAMSAAPFETPVPANLQGIWGKHGRCDILADRLTVTAHRVGWGKGPFNRVEYDAESGSIFWTQEYLVDNFVRGRAPDLLIHNTQGSDMPGEEGYTRCGRNLTRMPWPPR